MRILLQFTVPKTEAINPDSSWTLPLPSIKEEAQNIHLMNLGLLNIVKFGVFPRKTDKHYIIRCTNSA